MKILVLSDTHIPVAAKDLPEKVLKEAKKSDCCLHAGDFIEYPFYETLKGLIKTYAVYGNMDSQELKSKLPEKQLIELEGIKIGLIHGASHPANLLKYIEAEFMPQMDEIDIFVFGHSHCATDKEYGGKIYFNPGSPTDRAFAPYRSYGILEIEGASIKRMLVKIE